MVGNASDTWSRSQHARACWSTPLSFPTTLINMRMELFGYSLRPRAVHHLQEVRALVHDPQYLSKRGHGKAWRLPLELLLLLLIILSIIIIYYMII